MRNELTKCAKEKYHVKEYDDLAKREGACVDDATLQSEALQLAQRLARLPAHAAREIRQAFDSASQQGLSTQLQYEARRQRL